MNVVAFADGEDEKAAKDAGADTVGFEDLIDQVKKDKDLVADIVVATPDCMKKMGQLRKNIRTKEPYA
jgi:large subunit ribosomal protein L1